MSALPQPGRLLTIGDYAALPEDDQHRWELLEGSLLMSPSPTPRHMVAADAGIPHYWIIELDEPVSLVPCHLAAGFGYQDPGAGTGRYDTDAPFPVSIDLDALR
jgi:hypothetical protein